ncbi:MAG: hypothetical protein HYZ75_15820 [Elusimicrobia bacterium]|nr:hypothetical protein [Elusimicrobiota bacterium]
MNKPLLLALSLCPTLASAQFRTSVRVPGSLGSGLMAPAILTPTLNVPGLTSPALAAPGLTPTLAAAPSVVPVSAPKAVAAAPRAIAAEGLAVAPAAALVAQAATLSNAAASPSKFVVRGGLFDTMRRGPVNAVTFDGNAAKKAVPDAELGQQLAAAGALTGEAANQSIEQYYRSVRGRLSLAQLLTLTNGLVEADQPYYSKATVYARLVGEFIARPDSGVSAGEAVRLAGQADEADRNVLLLRYSWAKPLGWEQLKTVLGGLEPAQESAFKRSEVYLQIAKGTIEKAAEPDFTAFEVAERASEAWQTNLLLETYYKRFKGELDWNDLREISVRFRDTGDASEHSAAATRERILTDWRGTSRVAAEAPKVVVRGGFFDPMRRRSVNGVTADGGAAKRPVPDAEVDEQLGVAALQSKGWQVNDSIERYYKSAAGGLSPRQVLSLVNGLSRANSTTFGREETHARIVEHYFSLPNFVATPEEAVGLASGAGDWRNNALLERYAMKVALTWDSLNIVLSGLVRAEGQGRTRSDTYYRLAESYVDDSPALDPGVLFLAEHASEPWQTNNLIELYYLKNKGLLSGAKVKELIAGLKGGERGYFGRAATTDRIAGDWSARKR